MDDAGNIHTLGAELDKLLLHLLTPSVRSATLGRRLRASPACGGLSTQLDKKTTPFSGALLHCCMLCVLVVAYESACDS